MMQATSNVESSVSLYKKLVGAKRWETDEGIEKRAEGTFAEMCNVYGEDNAVQMVRFEIMNEDHDVTTWVHVFPPCVLWLRGHYPSPSFR